MGLSNRNRLRGGLADPLSPKSFRMRWSASADSKNSKVFSLNNVLHDNVGQYIDEGIMIGVGRIREAAEKGYACKKRKMPW